MCQTIGTAAALINSKHMQLINVITSFKLQGPQGHTANSISNKSGSAAPACDSESWTARIVERISDVRCVCTFFFCDEVAIRRINECVRM